LRTREAELAAIGATLLFVGNGSPAQAADFASQHAGPHPVFSDRARATYQAAGLRRSWFATLHWRLLRNAWRAFRNGFRQSSVQGDALQQGGVLVFGGGGQLRYQQVDRAGGDELDLAALMAAARGN